MPRFEYSIRHDQALGGEIDLASLVADTPATFSVKGMFLSGMAAELDERVRQEVLETLSVRPRLGRHLPFTDYPVHDFQRFLHAVARTRYGGVGTREGFRRAGRKTFPTFAASTIGKVFLTTTDDAQSALLRYPEAYRLTAKGGFVRAEAKGSSGLVVRWDDYRGSSEFALGLLEGVVLAFGGFPKAHVIVESIRGAQGHKVGWHQIEIEW